MNDLLKAWETIKAEIIAKNGEDFSLAEDSELEESIKEIDIVVNDYMRIKKIHDYTLDKLQGCIQDNKELAKETNKKLKALNIISQNFELVGNCLHAKNKYAERGWVFVKEIEDEEELKAWEEVLL